jgi:cysteine synthase
MNLSDILKEENPTVRHMLYENWKQDQEWKAKLELQNKHPSIRVKAGEKMLETAFKKVT